MSGQSCQKPLGERALVMSLVSPSYAEVYVSPRVVLKVNEVKQFPEW